MTPETILYPSFAMFALTLGLLFSLGFARFRAIHSRQVSIRYFRTYDEGEQPAFLHRFARHVQNHFEVPPLFHVGVVLAYVTGQVSTATLALAWAYVGARVVHSAIHLGYNNVSQRFFVFGLSLVVLGGLWGTVLTGVMGNG